MADGEHAAPQLLLPQVAKEVRLIFHWVWSAHQLHLLFLFQMVLAFGFNVFMFTFLYDFVHSSQLRVVPSSNLLVEPGELS